MSTPDIYQGFSELRRPDSAIQILRKPHSGLAQNETETSYPPSWINQQRSSNITKFPFQLKDEKLTYSVFKLAFMSRVGESITLLPISQSKSIIITLPPH